VSAPIFPKVFQPPITSHGVNDACPVLRAIWTRGGFLLIPSSNQLGYYLMILLNKLCDMSAAVAVGIQRRTPFVYVVSSVF